MMDKANLRQVRITRLVKVFEVQSQLIALTKIQ